MSKWQVLERGIALTLMTCVLAGCAGSSPTPIIIVPAETSTPIPVFPTATRPIPTPVAPTATTAPTITATEQSNTTELATTPEETTTPSPVAATENPMNQPFLMRIDKISVIVGRGTYLEGRVARGTLQGNDGVEILGPQNSVIQTTVLGVFISSTVRDQVIVGDYAGVLVQNVETTNVSPGMVLAAAGGYDTYEEALQELQ